jgi:hypothetical protein
MVSYKNLFLIKGISVWLWLSSTFSSIWSAPSYMSGVIRRWFDPESTTWYLSSHRLFPLLYHYRYGLDEFEWKYRTDTNELIQHIDAREEKDKEDKYYRVSWLSARTVSHSVTKDMDDFLSSLRIRGENLDSISSTILLQAWSLYDKRWWSSEHHSRLEWIDVLADEGSTPCTEAQPVPVVPCRISKKN